MNDKLQKINQRVQVDLNSDRGSGFGRIDRSAQAIESELEAWKEFGPVTEFQKEDGDFIVKFNPNHPLNEQFDRYFFNAYTSFGKDPDGTVVMPS